MNMLYRAEFAVICPNSITNIMKAAHQMNVTYTQFSIYTAKVFTKIIHCVGI